DTPRAALAHRPRRAPPRSGARLSGARAPRGPTRRTAPRRSDSGRAPRARRGTRWATADSWGDPPSSARVYQPARPHDDAPHGAALGARAPPRAPGERVVRRPRADAGTLDLFSDGA